MKPAPFNPSNNDLGVPHVIVDGLHGLPPSLVGVDRLGRLLHGVGHAVELGGGAAQPELVEAVALARAGGARDLFRHHCEAAADAGEAGGLGEAAELDGALLGPVDLVDGVRDLRLGDEGLVGGVEEDHAVVGVGVVDPLRQLGVGGHGAGRVVGEAEVDDVDLLGGSDGMKPLSAVQGI